MLLVQLQKWLKYPIDDATEYNLDTYKVIAEKSDHEENNERYGYADLCIACHFLNFQNFQMTKDLL